MDSQRNICEQPSWVRTSQLNLHAVKQGFQNVHKTCTIILGLVKTNKAEIFFPGDTLTWLS
jgi:hypothetical protein